MFLRLQVLNMLWGETAGLKDTCLTLCQKNAFLAPHWEVPEGSTSQVGGITKKWDTCPYCTFIPVTTLKSLVNECYWHIMSSPILLVEPWFWGPLRGMVSTTAPTLPNWPLRRKTSQSPSLWVPNNWWRMLAGPYRIKNEREAHFSDVPLSWSCKNDYIWY